MPDPYSVASPHPGYHILAQFHASRECWVFRVFGPDAAWYGTFKTAEEAIAFVRDSTEPSDVAVTAERATSNIS